MTSGAFSRTGLQVLAVSVIVHLLQLVSQTGLPIILIANVALLVYLRHQAMRMAREERDGFDPVIAAEVMVAFGVLSLIFGLATSLAPLLFTDLAFDWSGLKRLSLPFVEGLATAGAAPFFAVLLRLQAFEEAREVDPVGDMTGLAAVARDLADEMRAAVRSANDLQAALLAAGVSTARMAREVETESGRFGAALTESQGHVRTLTAAAQAGGTEMNRLANETQRLNGAAGDASDMLGELSRLIETVERFVRPDAAGTGR